MVAADASLFRSILRACEKQVGDVGDEQCCGLWGDSRVCSREKVEGGVGGEGGTAVVEVGEKCVAVVVLWTKLSIVIGLDIEHSVLSSIASSNE